jgi:hypothetical protein
MAWVESSSPSFRARHHSGESRRVAEMLDSLERLRDDLDQLSPFYVWTTDYAEKRLAWSRRHPLHVILLRTYRIPRPVTVKVRDEFLGGQSWLELTRDLPFEGTPVLSDEEFERASEEIASIASDRQPVLV